MICDNCGAIIDKNEEYCPNCGMELLTPKPRKKYEKSPAPIKHNYNISRENKDPEEPFSYTKPHSIEKPLQKKYMQSPESPDYSQYHEEEEYEDEYYPEESNYPEETKKSGVGLGSIILFLLIALVLGFIAGLFMFGSQSIPQIPGFNA